MAMVSFVPVVNVGASWRAFLPQAQKTSKYYLEKFFLKRKEKKKRQYSRETYKNLPEYEKQKLLEYRAEYYTMKKNTLL